MKRFLGARRPAWLAKVAGVEQSTVGRILKGEMKPSFDTIAPLANALEVHPSEFFEDKQAVISRKVTLEPDQIEALRGIWREMAKEEQLENPDALIIAERVPKDVLDALASWEGDWDLLRAVLDIRTPKLNKKANKANS